MSQSPFGDKAKPKILAAAEKFGIEAKSEEVVRVAENDTEDLAFDLARLGAGV